jgi:hypothetical protein
MVGKFCLRYFRTSSRSLVGIIRLLASWRKTVLPFVREKKIDACLALWVLPSGLFANYVHQETRVPYSVWALGSDVLSICEESLSLSHDEAYCSGGERCFADGFGLKRKWKNEFGKKCYFLATTRKIHLEPKGANEPNGLNKLYRPNKPNEPAGKCGSFRTSTPY